MTRTVAPGAPPTALVCGPVVAAGLDRIGTDGPGRAAGSPPRARVAQMACSLDFYLGLGCEIGTAADGWALLRHGTSTFVLVQAAEPPRRGSMGSGPWVRLSHPDVRALRRQLLSAGVPVGPVSRSDPAHAGEIVLIDPDDRPVVIAQPAPAAAYPPIRPRTATFQRRPRALPRHVTPG